MKSKSSIYKELVAPNGKKSNLTPEQYALVRTKAFKDWFGDWENDPANASKVVDVNGEPLVVHHGTYVENPFYIFDFNKADLGFHFGTDEQAKNRSETKLFFKGRKSIVAAFFLNIKTIFEATDIGEWEYPQRYIDMFVSDGLISESDAKKNGFYRLVQKEENKPIREYLLNKYGKFVGFVYNNKYEGKGKSFIVLNRSQIKLADGTNTTFDGSNPDIRYGDGGLIAPNGKKSNLNAEQYKLVRSKAFKAWFGDWENDPANASKVVDENGEPLVCYHNSDSLFNEFDLSYFGKSDGGYAGVGFYFATKSIKGYGKYEYQCFLSIKNPLIRNNNNWKDSFMPYSWIPNRANEKNESSIRNASKEWTSKAKEIGYNGFIDEGGEIVAFYPNQIKLADGSNTTFDGSNPDIRYDEGGRVEDFIREGIVDLKMYDTTPEHAKEYGLDSVNPLYVQSIYISENQRLKGIGKQVLAYIEKYAIENGHDVVFGHITQKAEPSVDVIKSMLVKSGFNTCEGNNDFYRIIGISDIRYNDGGLIAPNGKKSNLTAEQYKLVRTKAFKDWFGDWENDPANASKVIDENGEPLVVYRGWSSNNKFGNVFGYRRNLWGSKTSLSSRKSNRFGFYFTTDKKVAKIYADDFAQAYNDDLEYKGSSKEKAISIVQEYFLKIQNVCDISPSNKDFPSLESKISDVQKVMKQKTLQDIKKTETYNYTTSIGTKSLSKIVGFKLNDIQSKADDLYERRFQSNYPFEIYSYMINDGYGIDVVLKDALIENKYDGVRFQEDTHYYGSLSKKEQAVFDKNESKGLIQTYPDVYVAFEPEQIKLADGTNTTFDGNNPDIRFNNGGEVDKNILKDFSNNIEAYQSNHYGSFNRDKLVEIYMSLPISVKQKIQPQSTKKLFRGADGFDSKKSAISFTKNKDYAKFFGTYTIPFSVLEKHEGLIDTRKLSNYLYDLGIQNEIGDDEGEVIVINPIFKKNLQAKIENFKLNNGGEMKSMKHGTITEGASHDDGGIKVLNKSTNQILEVEGGEGVVNKHSMASNKKVKLNGKEMTICEAVSQLNQMDGNGVKFDCDKVEHRQFIEKMDLGGELEKGIRTEQEHIQTLKELYSKQITPEQASEKIAKEHLAENPAYYSKLQAIEQSKKNNADLIMKLGGMTNEHTYTFEDFGLIKDFKENPFHKLAEMLKKSNNFCDIEPKYCVTSLDIDRKDMPQVYEEYIPEYVDFLEKQGIDSQMKYNVQVSDLKPTQKNISVERISKILHRLLSGYYTGENGQLLNPLKRVVIATKDGYLLDGHHRWATSLFLSPKNTITVLEINADIADLIPITKGFKKTEYQEFMFGGRVEVLDKTSSTPEAVKTFTAYKGGFPKKGLVVSPLLVYERNVREYKFAEDAFMIEIPSRSLQDYLKPSTLRLAKYLKDNLQKTSGERFYPYGLGNTFYPRLSLGIADYSDFRRNDVGTIAVSKQGQTRAIFFVPSESQLKLLNDDTFLEHFLQALNLVTKTPFAPVNIPKEKKQKVFVKNISGTSQKLKDATIVQSFDTEGIDNQLVALQKLMESFTEDEIEVRRYILNEIDKLRGEKEKKLNESLFTTNFTGLLDLYASKVSLQQLPLKKNPCNLTTPSGAPSELDMLQYSIVRTPAFKNWFGDWEEAFKSKNYNGVSKAINERTGEPLVMYHGKSFMKTEMTSFSTPINVNFPIKYFAEESNYSAYFADLDSSKQSLSAIFEFFIRCVNPMDFTSIGTETITPEIFRKVVEAIYGYEIKSPMIMEGVPQKVWQILRGNVPMLNEIRQNTNFDGFKLYEDNPDAPNKGFAEKTLDFAVYSNTAMKAADGRNTTFLKDVESFRFEQGGLVNN